MYRDIMLHYTPQRVIFWSRSNKLRVHRPGKASADRLARVLYDFSKVGLLELGTPARAYLGAWYRVWDVKPKSPSTL